MKNTTLNLYLHSSSVVYDVVVIVVDDVISDKSLCITRQQHHCGLSDVSASQLVKNVL